jgi:hypothetical protein
LKPSYETTGGISVTAVGHPFDTIKVRLQTQPMDKPIYGEPPWLLCRASEQCLSPAMVCFKWQSKAASVHCSMGEWAAADVVADVSSNDAKAAHVHWLQRHQTNFPLQLQHKLHNTQALLQVASNTHLLMLVLSHVPVPAAGVVDCAKKTVQWEGLPGLYKVGSHCSR